MTNELINSIENTIYPENTLFSGYRIIIIESFNTQFKYEH